MLISARRWQERQNPLLATLVRLLALLALLAISGMVAVYIDTEVWLFLVVGGIMMALAMKKYRPDTKVWIIVLSAVFFVFLLLYTGLMLLHVGGPFSYSILLTHVFDN